MSNLPKIWANCKAGCAWETVHRSEFEQAATFIEQGKNADGLFELQVGKEYKIIAPVDSNFQFTDSIEIPLQNNPSTTTLISKENIDEYARSYTIRVLDIQSKVVVYEFMGVRYRKDFLNSLEPRVFVRGATECYLYNTEANMEVRPISVTNAYLTPKKHLMIVLSDGNEIDVGSVVPFIIKAGIYRFNDVLNFTSEETITEDVNFEVVAKYLEDGITYKAVCNRFTIGEQQMFYYVNHSTPQDPNGVLPTNILIHDENGWNGVFDDGIKTVIVPEDTVVSEAFHKQFNANVKALKTVNFTVSVQGGANGNFTANYTATEGSTWAIWCMEWNEKNHEYIGNVWENREGFVYFNDIDGSIDGYLADSNGNKVPWVSEIVSGDYTEYKEPTTYNGEVEVKRNDNN